jgi:hypothetical protein
MPQRQSINKAMPVRRGGGVAYAQHGGVARDTQAESSTEMQAGKHHKASLSARNARIRRSHFHTASYSAKLRAHRLKCSTSETSEAAFLRVGHKRRPWYSLQALAILTVLSSTSVPHPSSNWFSFTFSSLICAGRLKACAGGFIDASEFL